MPTPGSSVPVQFSGLGLNGGVNPLTAGDPDPDQNPQAPDRVTPVDLLPLLVGPTVVTHRNLEGAYPAKQNHRGHLSVQPEACFSQVQSPEHGKRNQLQARMHITEI